MTAMNGYVALASSLTPEYAVYLPLTCRVWMDLGYAPVVLLHDTPWDSPLARIVIEELEALGPAKVYRLPQIEPLSVANTMRCSRLVASAWEGLPESSRLFTSDVDIVPVSRAAFTTPGRALAVRADGAVLVVAGQKLAALSMSYVALEVRDWRRLFDLIVGDPEGSLRKLIKTPCDRTSYDEVLLSSRIIVSDLAEGHIEHVDGYHYRQGLIELICESERRGDVLMRYKRTPIHRRPRPEEDVLTLIPGRPPPPWLVEVAGTYFPRIAGWLANYYARTKEYWQ